MSEQLGQAVATYLRSASSSRLRGREVELVEQWRGRDNLLWRLRSDANDDLVLKLFQDAGQARSRRQFSAQERFAPLDLAPNPRWYDRYPEGLSRQILVYDWVPGDAPDLADPSMDEQLAEGVARIHSAEPTEMRFSPHPFNLATFWQIWQASRRPLSFRAEKLGANRLLQKLETLWENAETLMRSILDSQGETVPTPIHGELQQENLLYHRGRLRFLDWEFAGLGDPAQEVARLLLHFGAAWSEERRQRWIEIYCRLRPSEQLRRRIDTYRRLLPFESASSILHGLVREIEQDPTQFQDVLANLPFVTQTVLSALDESDRMLTESSQRQFESNDVALQQELERFILPDTEIPRTDTMEEI